MKEQSAELSQLNTEYLQAFGFPTPRFHPREQLPVLREGEVLGKFHGVPVRLPARAESDPVDAAGYSEFQRDILNVYEVIRRRDGVEVFRALQDPNYQMQVQEIVVLDSEGDIYEL